MIKIFIYGMKMGMKPGVISKGMNDHHKAWSSVREAKHGTKEKILLLVHHFLDLADFFLNFAGDLLDLTLYLVHLAFCFFPCA